MPKRFVIDTNVFLHNNSETVINGFQAVYAMLFLC